MPVSIISLPDHPGRVALLGNPNYSCANGVPIGSAVLEQTIQVPAGKTVAFSFSYRLLTEDVKYSRTYNTDADTLQAFVKGTNGQWSSETIGGEYRELSCGSWFDTGWRRYNQDLSQFAGQTVTLSFVLSNRIDGWYNTYAYVDDVTLVSIPN